MTPRKSARASDTTHVQACSAPRDADGVRERLLRCGLRYFAEQGYARTSIRQIAAGAQANVAAISYYFGDKTGLYRAVFRGTPDPTRDTANRSIASLQEMYTRILEPLKQGDAVRQWVMLVRREMLEPTGLWEEKVEHDMRPMHEALVALLCRELKLERADDEVRRLAITVAGLAMHLFVGCDVIDALAPQLADRPQAIDVWRDRLVLYARALIAAERRRRASCAPRARPHAPSPRVARSPARSGGRPK